MKHRLIILPALIVAIVAAFTMACGGSDNTSSTPKTGSTAPPNTTPVATSPTGAATGSGNIPETKISAKEYSYTSPDSISGGLVRLTLSNDGKEPHQAQVVKLNAGVTPQQFQDALKAPDPGPLFKIVSLMGGPNTVDPGQSQSVVVNMPAGQYALLCFVTDDNNVPHLAKGMVKMFTVTAPSGTEAGAPKATDQVTTADFNFLGIDSLSAGKHTIQVTNGGPQPHELAILKLKPGVTVDQLKQEIASESGGPPPASGTPGATTAPSPAANRTPASGTAGGSPTPSTSASANQDPVTDAGGLGAQDKGGTGWVDVNLDAGNYAFVCFVPDAATGKPHAALGMIKAVTVK